MTAPVCSLCISTKNAEQETASLKKVFLEDKQLRLVEDFDGGEEPLFDCERYFDRLKTKELGHVVLNSDALPSTQDLIKQYASSLPAGTICIAQAQLSGRGRRDNVWESPKGCLMFSTLTRLAIDPSRLPFLNYVACIAIIRGIKGKEVDVKIKWPNDIYFEQQKIGGVLFNSSIRTSVIQLITGIGLNVTNAGSRLCLKEIFEKTKLEMGSVDAGDITPRLEDVLAEIVNNLETLLLVFSESGFEPVKEEYLSYWMHSGQKLTIDSADVIVEGITNNGYLRGAMENGESVELFPDGNSVDMMAGLIVRHH